MNLLSLLTGAGALCAAGFTLVTLARLRTITTARRDRAPEDRDRPWPSVLLLRPVDAPTLRERENLSIPIDYPGALEHRVVSPFRPRLGDGVEWLYSDPTVPNRKVGHVAYALAVLGARGRHVLVVDADVAVDGALVRALVEPLERGAALSVAPPRLEDGGEAGSFAAASLLGHTHHDFAALHAVSAGAKAICGKAIGLSPQAAEELCRLGDHLGEDLELSERLHGRGLQVALAQATARVPSGAGSLREVFERFTRWMLVLRSHRPGLYPTVPLLLAGAPLWTLLAIASGARPAWGAVAALWVMRALLSMRLAQVAGERITPATPLRWFVGELLLQGAWLASLGRRTVAWRGRRYALGAGGRIRPLTDASLEVALR